MKSLFKKAPMLWDFFSHFVLFAPQKSVVRRIARLTVAGLIVSVAALIVVLSVMTALNRNQRERTLAVEPHLTIEPQSGTTLINFEKHESLVKLHSLFPSEMQVFETQDVILRSLDGRFHGAVAKGLKFNAIKSMLENVQKISHKQGLSNFESYTALSEPAADEIYLGTDLAHSLGVFEGDNLLVIPPESLLLPPSEAPRFERVKVRQILTTNVAQVDGQLLYYVAGKSLKSLQNSASLRRGAEIRFPDPETADQAKEELLAFKDLKIQTWKERNSALFFALRLEKTMMGTFLGMAILVASLSLVSVLSLLISQKTKEIGLLGALGFSQNGVQSLFTQIGFLLAVIGMGTGALVGTAISLYLEFFPLNILPDIYYDSEIPAEVQWGVILMILVIGLGVAAWGARFAVRTLKNQSPSNLLRRTN